MGRIIRGYRDGLHGATIFVEVENIRLGSLSLDCAEPTPLAAFWAALLGGEVAFTSDNFVAVKTERMWVSAVKVDDYRPPTWPGSDLPKQMHLDLAVDNLAESEAEAVRLGAVKLEFQPAPDRYIVLLDPAGHPFCLTTQIPQ